jgi:hypothetical protein
MNIVIVRLIRIYQAAKVWSKQKHPIPNYDNKGKEKTQRLVLTVFRERRYYGPGKSDCVFGEGIMCNSGGRSFFPASQYSVLQVIYL